ncbi:MAG: MvdC/MvdD family ATP grasp protein [Oceanicaulis sp.]
MSVLILSPSGDAHGDAVHAALRDREVETVRLSGADFPVRDTLSIWLGAGRHDLRVETERTGVVDLSRVDAVWRRRGEYPRIDAEQIHPEDRRFAHKEAEAAADGLRDVSALLGRAAWINPRRAALQAQNKPYQLAQAMRAGLAVPPTLISNAPVEVRAFCQAAANPVIYKPLTAAVWEDEGAVLAYFVTELDAETLADDDLLRATPGIYQEKIDKAFELRVTVMDRFVHAVKIDSQALEAAQTDWRRHIDELAVKPFALPQEVEARVLDFMAAMGLRFGALDLIVTPEGEHIFLEVNEMGQFLWIEQSAPSERLLAHFCAYLCCTERPYRGGLGRFETARFADYEPKPAVRA